jgi:segregation and condensation protein B
MEITNLIPHIEALVFASDKPLTSIEITELINNAFGFMEDKIVLDQVEASLEGIVEKYQSEFYPFEVKQSGGGWQFLTKRDFHKTIAQLNGEKFLKRLSAAAMETLSIIAYKQPITKSEIEAIRGVNCDYAVQKLLEKELVIISGRNEHLPGKPLVYATSKNFMDYFGINNTDDLPKIKEVLAEQNAEPTIITTGFASEAAEETVLVLEEEATPESLAVAPNGELIAATTDETDEVTATEEIVSAAADTAPEVDTAADADAPASDEEEDTPPTA